jgi:hypothetical protein
MDHAIQSILHEATPTVGNVPLEHGSFQVGLFGFFSFPLGFGRCVLLGLNLSQDPELFQRLSFALVVGLAYALGQGI